MLLASNNAFFSVVIIPLLAASAAIIIRNARIIMNIVNTIKVTENVFKKNLQLCMCTSHVIDDRKNTFAINFRFYAIDYVVNIYKIFI